MRGRSLRKRCFLGFGGLVRRGGERGGGLVRVGEEMGMGRDEGRGRVEDGWAVGVRGWVGMGL